MLETTAQLLEELKQVSEGLTYNTEGDNPIEPFVWEVSQKGELTPEKLLLSEGYLSQVEIDDIFPQNLKFHNDDLPEEQQAEDRKQLEFIDFLRSRCKTVEVYFVEKYDAPRELDEKFESFPLILAETGDGEWIGIAPEVDADFSVRFLERNSPFNSEREKEFWMYALWDMQGIPPEILDTIPLHCKADFYIRFDLESLLRSSDIIDWSYNLQERLMDQEKDSIEKLLQIDAQKKQEVNKTTHLLATEIKEMLFGMKLFTRQFYQPHQSVDSFVIKVGKSKESILSNLVETVGFFRTCPFQEFSKEAEIYEIYEDDPDQAEYYTKLKPIDRFLVCNLSNLREYVVGCMSIFYLYDVGQTPDGDWVGVRTVGIWT